MNYASIVKNDTANAPGISVSVYCSGCDFHCPNCHNQEAQNFDYGEKFTANTIIEIAHALTENNIQRSLSVLGGEPLHPKNMSPISIMLSYIRTAVPETKIYLWTGYTMDELNERKKSEPNILSILNKIDYLIDGRYVDSKRDITLPLRGSRNQVVWKKNVDGIWEKDERYS